MIVISRITSYNVCYTKLLRKNSISSNFVSAILRLPNGQLWIGTERGGICQVINSNKIPSFQVFTEKNGLSNNVVKSIVYDNNQSYNFV